MITQLLRIRYPSVKRVGVWLTLQGYWQGLTEDFDGDAARFDLVKYETQGFDKVTRTWFLPHPDKLEGFWTHYFKALKMAGADFVKLDNQASMDFVLPTNELAVRCKNEVHEVVARVGKEVFGDGGIVYCMAHTPRIVAGEVGLGLQQGDQIWRCVFHSKARLHLNNDQAIRRLLARL